MHNIVCSLKNDPIPHQNAQGVTFFVELTEKYYCHVEKNQKLTFYKAALFAKNNQVDYYSCVLKRGSIVSVFSRGLFIDTDGKIMLADPKLDYCHRNFDSENEDQNEFSRY